MDVFQFSKILPVVTVPRTLLDFFAQTVSERLKQPLDEI
jgi:hypothetical protein